MGAAGFFGRQLLIALARGISRHERLIATALAVCTLLAWLITTKGKDSKDAFAVLRGTHVSDKAVRE